MVGHSFGVFVILGYAARYPHQVDGLVLVDPPSEWVRMDQRQTHLLWGAVHLSRLGGLLARLGIVRACLALLSWRRAGCAASVRQNVRVDHGPYTGTARG